MKKEIIVLGINEDGHNSSAALICDGEVLAAVEEERINNRKNYGGRPISAIKEVFKIADKDPLDVDLIASQGYVSLEKGSSFKPLSQWITRFLDSHIYTDFMTGFFRRFRTINKELDPVFMDLGLLNKEVIFVEHHKAHAASANYLNPSKDDVLVFTLDGWGDYLSSTVNIGRKNLTERIASSTKFNSPGDFYTQITALLGFKKWEHEYKVMGLAPYGKPMPCLSSIEDVIRLNPKNNLEFQNTCGPFSTHMLVKLRHRLEDHRFDNIASAAQMHLENIVTSWIKNAIDMTGLDRIACSGGCFQNVKMNKSIRDMEEVEDAFFTPFCDDGGLAIGAALEGYNRFCEREGIKPRRHEIKSPYLGRAFGNEQIEKAISDGGLSKNAEYIDDEEHIGELLAKGNIVARFQGREEFGRRALGNRSILADPRDQKVIKKLNQKIKNRDFWMPFAPSILEDTAQYYLINGRPSRYMMETFDTTKNGQEIVACLHPQDMTTRPQTVNGDNPKYRKILTIFQDLTGVGGVLNTSFNLHGYPIVGSPETAIWTFKNSGLDYLSIGNWLIRSGSSG